MQTLSNEIDHIKKGSLKHLAKTLTRSRSLTSQDFQTLSTSFYQSKKLPLVVSLMGNPGAGKSTFLNSLLKSRPENFNNIGLLLIDPSSPLTGGSLLGDRIRLKDHFLDDQIFIRSLSNENDFEGVGKQFCTQLMTSLLFPFDVVFLEAVGSGQTINKINQFSDLSIYIYDSNSGDNVQHIKSGAIDQANIVIVTKNDKDQAEAVLASLKESLVKNTDIFTFNEPNKKLDQDIVKSIFMAKKAANNSIKNNLLKHFFSRRLIELVNQFCDSKEVDSLTYQNEQVFIKKFFNFIQKNT